MVWRRFSYIGVALVVLASSDVQQRGSPATAEAAVRRRKGRRKRKRALSEEARAAEVQRLYSLGADAYNRGEHLVALPFLESCFTLMLEGTEERRQLERIIDKIRLNVGDGEGDVEREFRPELVPVKEIRPRDPIFDGVLNADLLKVFVTPLLSVDECQWIIKLCEERADWQARLQYDTEEVDLKQVPEVTRWLTRRGGLRERIFELLRKQFGLPPRAPLTIINSNVIRYDAAKPKSSYVEMHSDGAHRLTFNVLLSDASDFEGGGTHILHLNATMLPERGQMISYYGNAYHSGEPVTAGRRYIMQGFVDTAEDALVGEDEVRLLLVRKAIAFRPESRDAHGDLVTTLINLGRKAELAAAIEEFIVFGHDKARTVYLLILLAEARHELGNLVAAENTYREAFLLTPNDDSLVRISYEQRFPGRQLAFDSG